MYMCMDWMYWMDECMHACMCSSWMQECYVCMAVSMCVHVEHGGICMASVHGEHAWMHVSPSWMDTWMHVCIHQCADVKKQNQSIKKLLSMFHILFVDLVRTFFYWGRFIYFVKVFLTSVEIDKWPFLPVLGPCKFIYNTKKERPSRTPRKPRRGIETYISLTL